jgi:hypothetical protein
VQGVTLFRLADAVGLSQQQAAAALGLARTQTNLWAQGKRSIPDRHLPKLLELVGQAAGAALATLDAEPSRPGGRLQEALTRERALRKETILTLCEAVRMELKEDAGMGPTTMVAATLTALGKFVGMSEEELWKGNTPAELVEKESQFHEAVTLWQRLAPLERVLERGKRASCVEGIAP